MDMIEQWKSVSLVEHIMKDKWKLLFPTLALLWWTNAGWAPLARWPLTITDTFSSAWRWYSFTEMQTHKHRSVSSWGQSLCHPHFCGSNHQWLICQLLGVKGYRPNGQKVKGLVNNRPDSSKQTYIVYQGKKSDFWRESFRFISKCNCFLICNRNSCYFGLSVVSYFGLTYCVISW